MPDPRLLILINPGRQSRHYMLALERAAARLGLGYISTELAPIWQHLDKAPDRPAAEAGVHDQLRAIIRQHRLTHVLGYAFNGTGDIGLVPHAAPTEPTSPAGTPSHCLFASEGLTHLMLWTDHPEWCEGGRVLEPRPSSLLNHPNHVHFVKSHAAADELAHVAGWANVHPLAMAEDYDDLRPHSGAAPIHDVVAIVGDIGRVPDPARAHLENDDPDPIEIDRAMIPAALEAFESALAEACTGEVRLTPCAALAAAWLDARVDRPLDSFWRISRDLVDHAEALRWLEADPVRWYAAVRALRRMVAWRRNFALAWLASRLNLGLYGSSAQPLRAPARGDASWVAYARQPEVYARGRIVLNTNAAHDEEGLTHKPFQIAACGVPCLHHDVRELSDCFDPESEIGVFRRPAELLDAARALIGDEPRRAALADAMRFRAQRDHRWEHRLIRMLELSPEARSP
jgi:hypothetical protein